MLDLINAATGLYIDGMVNIKWRKLRQWANSGSTNPMEDKII